MNTEINKTNFEIDYSDLASEVQKQASLYQFYAEEAATAKEERDRLANKLDLTEADTNLEIRKSASASGTKLTEAMVSSMIEVDPTIVALKEELVQKNKDLNVIETAVKAMEQKCKMLDLAVRLKLSRSVNESDDAFDKETISDAVDSGIRSRLNK